MAKVTVTKGQTLSGIAKSAGTTVAAIQKANPNITNVNKINVGQNINLPGSTSIKVSTAKPTSTGSTNSATIKPAIKSGTTQGTSYNKYGSSTPKPIGSTISAAPKKSFLSNVFGKVKDAINTVSGNSLGANAYEGYVNNDFTYNDGLLQDAPVAPKPFSGAVEKFSNEFDKATYKKPKVTIDNSKTIGTGYMAKDNEATAIDAQGNYSTTHGGTAMNEDGTPQTINTLPKTNEQTPTSVIEKTTTPNADGSTTTTTSDLTPATNPNTYNAGYSNLTSQLGNIFTGLKDAGNTAFMSSESKGEFQKNKILNIATNAAKVFTTPEQASAYFASPEGQKASADFIAKGGKIEDIISKVTKVENGVTAPKTTAEYLAYKGNAVEEQRKLLNEGIAMEMNFTQKMKDVYLGNDLIKGVAQKQKEENETLISFLDRQEARAETSAREKAQYAIDKAKAEFEVKDAETEINRINAKNNLTEFLAKIGALRTDGNALTGLEILEQRYQAQRQQLRSNFLFAEREIRMDMNDRINTLQDNRDEKVFKLNQDLSKTEREVAMDVAKLDYGLQKDILGYKIKFADMIKDEKDKAEAKAEKYSSDWTNAYLTISGADMFKSSLIPEEFRREWISNNPKSPQGYKTTQEDLAKDFANWNKNQNNGIKMTDTQEFNLQKQGVDVAKYKIDEGYRTYVNSNLTE